MASSDCSQDPQGPRCRINFTAEAEDCVSELFLQRDCESQRSQASCTKRCVNSERKCAGEGARCVLNQPGGLQEVQSSLNSISSLRMGSEECCRFRVGWAHCERWLVSNHWTGKDKLMPVEWEHTAHIKAMFRSSLTRRTALKISSWHILRWILTFQVIKSRPLIPAFVFLSSRTDSVCAVRTSSGATVAVIQSHSQTGTVSQCL